MTFPLSAGVYENIIDESFIVGGDGPLTGAIIVESDRGPTVPTTVRSKRQLASLYGIAQPDQTALIAAERFMRYGRSLTVLRMPGTATKSTATIMTTTTTAVADVTAANPGTWGNNIHVTVEKPLSVDTAIDGGASAGTGGPLDGHFVISVYESPTAPAPGDTKYRVERFDVSRNPQARDGFGNSVFVDDVINTRSLYITIEDDNSVTGDYDQSTVVTLTGGTDNTSGSLASAIGGSAGAWETYFMNEEEVEADILIDGGYAATDIHNSMIAVAESRANCRAILDFSETIACDNPNAVDDMITYRKGMTDSHKVAIYGGWIRVYNSSQARDMLIPPSGDVAGLIVNTFQNHEPWDAVAGIRRGVINALGVSKIFRESDRDSLYQAGINPITTIGGSSAVIWGQKTLQSAASALDRLNVVNSVMWMTDRMKSALQPFVFEPNNQFVRDNINYILSQFLEGVLTRGGLYDFRVDTESSNTPQVIDQNQLIIDVWIQPVRTAEFIRLNVTVTPTGVELDSL